MKLIVASNNKNKLREIKQILGGRFELVSLAEAGIDIEIEETGKTFYENAMIKAKTICDMTGCPSLADDSGLMVDYLNGEPGVYSARYAGEPANDSNNNKKLLLALDGVEYEKRTASYVSTVIVVYPNGDSVFAEGRSNGYILTAPRGNNGFGYDPLFYSPEIDKTYAEADADEKNAISHRGRALVALAEKIK